MIRPLFLDELEEQLDRATTGPDYDRFLAKISSLTFLDPACASGNFLIITYRELRRLELRAVRDREATSRGRLATKGQRVADLDLLLNVSVNQFFGIELEEFPAEIARTGMYLIDHICNREASAELGESYARFPIPTAPNIVQANALIVDWASVLPAEHAAFVFGNPPFQGHQNRSKQQSEELRYLWGKSHYNKLLDYVTGWYRTAVDYGLDQAVRFAFVSTNSIAQGEQVGRLWQPLLDAGFRIDFAHQSFHWESEARGKAHVTVVIVGFSHDSTRQQRLFTYPDPYGEPVSIQPKVGISPYLTDGPDLAVLGRSRGKGPLSSSMPVCEYGSLASDGTHLQITPVQLQSADDAAKKWIRPYLGSREVMTGKDRYVIWAPEGIDPVDLGESELLRERLARVASWRANESDNPDSQALAAMPYRFFHVAQPDTDYLGIPAQVSHNRRYFTPVRLPSTTIASNTLYVAEDPDGFLFGILSSSMFITWLANIGGQIRKDYRYAVSIVHNTYPIPESLTEAQRAAVVEAGLALDEVRGRYGDAPLDKLYDPLAMPRDIIRAHGEIDKAVDRIYGRQRGTFQDADRLPRLLQEYVELLARHN